MRARPQRPPTTPPTIAPVWFVEPDEEDKDTVEEAEGVEEEAVVRVTMEEMLA